MHLATPGYESPRLHRRIVQLGPTSATRLQTVFLKILRLLAEQLRQNLLGYPVANFHGRLLQVIPTFL
jgi:hypothetical protein